MIHGSIRSRDEGKPERRGAFGRKSVLVGKDTDVAISVAEYEESIVGWCPVSKASTDQQFPTATGECLVGDRQHSSTPYTEQSKVRSFRIHSTLRSWVLKILYARLASSYGIFSELPVRPAQQSPEQRVLLQIEQGKPQLHSQNNFVMLRDGYCIWYSARAEPHL